MDSSGVSENGRRLSVGANDSVIIISDSESVHSNESVDLFDSDENSRDVAEVDAVVSNNVDSPPECEASFWEDDIVMQESRSVSNKSDLLCDNSKARCHPGHPEASADIKQVDVELQSKSLVEGPKCESAMDYECSSGVKNQLDISLSRMKNDPSTGIRSFNQYMQLKKDKLLYQVNVLDRPSNITSSIFKGISIFVNGYTNPSALELRQLIQVHGGVYHCYYEYGVTTYTIATSLATAKVSTRRRDEKYVKPEWIVDCIAAGKLLDVDWYLLLPTQKNKSITAALYKRSDNKDADVEPRILDARDPNFLEEYYARSRLHLISTLAQEMKDYVQIMRSDASHAFTGRENLLYLIDDNYVSPTASIIFHVDLDCFFVSVALRGRPDLVDKPVAVTHSKGVSRGFSELASVNYAARKRGLKNGMIVRDAIKLCPNLVCLPYLFDDYRIIAKTIYTVVSRYTLEIKAVSCDEMYIDCTKLLNDMRISDPQTFAEHLRAEIKLETGCPASVGIGRNPLIARLATRHAKPDGVRFVTPSETEFFIANEKVKNLPGMGHQTYSKIGSAFGNIETCRDLQAVSRSELERALGKKVADQVYKMCRGEDDEKDFVSSNVRKSISCDINYGIRFTKDEVARDIMNTQAKWGKIEPCALISIHISLGPKSGMVANVLTDGSPWVLDNKSEVSHFLNVIAQELEKKLKEAKMVTSAITLKLMIRSPDAPVQTEKYLGHGKCDVLNKSTALDHPTGCSQVITMTVLKLFGSMAPIISDIRGIGIQCGRLALTKDVGYSLKSEAISRMFRVREKNKGNKKVVRTPEPEKDLPLAFSTRPPSFFGERNVAKIKEELIKYLNNEPEEDTVGVVSDFLFYLLRDGCLSTLNSICLMLHRELYSFDEGNRTDSGWLFAMNVIFDMLDERCRKMYGAAMIRPAIERCQER